MPDISTSTKFFYNHPNAFVSMLSDETPPAFYSSISVPGVRGASDCVRCALVPSEQNQLTRKGINDFISELVRPPGQSSQPGGVVISSNVIPTPPLPTPPDA